MPESPFPNVAVPFSEGLRSKAQVPASRAQRSRLPSRSSGWKRIGSGSGTGPDPLGFRTVFRNGFGVGEGGNGRRTVPALSLCTLTLLLRAGKPRSAEETMKEFGTPEVSSRRVAPPPRIRGSGRGRTLLSAGSSGLRDAVPRRTAREGRGRHRREAWFPHGGTGAYDTESHTGGALG